MLLLGSEEAQTPVAPPTSSVLAAVATARLLGCGQPAFQDIVCEETDGILCLRGSVPGAQWIPTALSVVAPIAGLRGIDNRLTVTRAGVRRPVATALVLT